jgi:hypothetical protein
MQISNRLDGGNIRVLGISAAVLASEHGKESS